MKHLLVLIMTLTLFACGGKDAGDTAKGAMESAKDTAKEAAAATKDAAGDTMEAADDADGRCEPMRPEKWLMTRWRRAKTRWKPVKAPWATP